MPQAHATIAHAHEAKLRWQMLSTPAEAFFEGFETLSFALVFVGVE